MSITEEFYRQEEIKEYDFPQEELEFDKLKEATDDTENDGEGSELSMCC